MRTLACYGFKSKFEVGRKYINGQDGSLMLGDSMKSLSDEASLRRLEKVSDGKYGEASPTSVPPCLVCFCH